MKVLGLINISKTKSNDELVSYNEGERGYYKKMILLMCFFLIVLNVSEGNSSTATLDNRNITETENSKKGKSSTATLDNSNIAETETENSKKGSDAGRSASMVLASFVMLEYVLCIVIQALRGIEEVFTYSKFRNSGKKITFLLTSLLFILPIAAAADYEIEVNYDVGNYKFLQINQTLELTCKNKLNRDQPSWTYSSRLYNDPRMRFDRDVGESRLVISNAQAGDAGRYMCLIDHEYNGESFHYNKTIEVIVNEILEVKVEDAEDSIKLLCNVQAYPSPTIIWKIDYDNKDLNPQPEGPGLIRMKTIRCHLKKKLWLMTNQKNAGHCERTKE